MHHDTYDGWMNEYWYHLLQLCRTSYIMMKQELKILLILNYCFWMVMTVVSNYGEIFQSIGGFPSSVKYALQREKHLMKKRIRSKRKESNRCKHRYSPWSYKWLRGLVGSQGRWVRWSYHSVTGIRNGSTPTHPDDYWSIYLQNAKCKNT